MCTPPFPHAQANRPLTLSPSGRLTESTSFEANEPKKSVMPFPVRSLSTSPASIHTRPVDPSQSAHTPTPERQAGKSCAASRKGNRGRPSPTSMAASAALMGRRTVSMPVGRLLSPARSGSEAVRLQGEPTQMRVVTAAAGSLRSSNDETTVIFLTFEASHCPGQQGGRLACRSARWPALRAPSAPHLHRRGHGLSCFCKYVATQLQPTPNRARNPTRSLHDRLTKLCKSHAGRPSQATHNVMAQTLQGDTIASCRAKLFGETPISIGFRLEPAAQRSGLRTRPCCQAPSRVVRQASED